MSTGVEKTHHRVGALILLMSSLAAFTIFSVYHDCVVRWLELVANQLGK